MEPILAYVISETSRFARLMDFPVGAGISDELGVPVQ